MNTFTRFLIIKGLQPVTVQGHVKTIDRIAKQIGTNQPTHEQASEFIATLYTSGYSYNHKINQARALEYWMEYRGMPIRFGRQKKPRRLLKETLTEAEVTRMIFACKNSREQAIVTLVAYSGLRPKEVGKVRIGDVDFGTNQLRVEQGKGFKDGIVYLQSKCVRTLMAYLAEQKRDAGDFLFKTYQGNPYNAQALRKFIKILAVRAGIERRVYPYLLRHALATNMIKRGAPLLLVKEHFRHAWIETTMLYVHSIGLQERNEQFYPHYI